MSDVFFRDLDIAPPDANLGVGSGTHGWQTGAMLAAIEPVLEARRPDWVLVYGDTNSTLAAALASVKIELPLAHLEAGLRSFNRRMPEEHNRVLTDHAADLCLAPTQVALNNLVAEGLGDRSVVTGDVMTDVCLSFAEKEPVLSEELKRAHGEYIVSTIHRAENTNDPSRLSEILGSLSRLPLPVILTAHPRLISKAKDFGLVLESGAVHLIPPLEYPQMVDAVAGASAVLTDSGGLQKEAFLLGTPCVTIRTETEWTETVDLGWNTLCPDPDDIAVALSGPKPQPTYATPYGDGHAATRVIEALEEFRRATS
ncbi:UDP-N-acetylglucosamine 2-epimerase (non-hydrolyzing) [Terrabacter aerolatus]|uniref:UDP-N-acetyl glucosamine 2-epimerase n=2 Tax=Terrabacter aerolatus TaxID=422442 RepID=A0A512CZQ2_9MICO|nr:UDP-N-acetyl glucosamine 2-epimerase [Terrabacter aerolatus]